LPERAFRTVLALDSLEHNDDLDGILGRLTASLADDGRLVISGPTESALYRLGRRIAGFSGHYHKQTVHDVEAAAAKLLRRVSVSSVPPLGALFRISVWRQSLASRRHDA
jgi:hypothetical protein